MLKLKYLFENFALAKSVLENWGYDEECLEEYFRYFRISSNAVYPFPREGKCYFLRLSPVEEKMEKNLRGELAFLQYLKEAGYTAVRPVPSKTGEVLLKLDTPWGGYFASVFERVAGISIEETDYNEIIMFAYGKQLGKLHQLSMDYKPSCKKWSYEDVLVWSHEVLLKYQAPKFMISESSQVSKELCMLPKGRDNFGLVHYDFEPDNVFYDEVRQCCNVIDFEDSMYHFYILDIEQVIDSLREELGETACEKAICVFLKGYQTEMNLEPGYEKDLVLMRRFCNLYAYARLIRCVEEKLQDEPDWMIELREKLNQKMQDIESTVISLK